VTALIVARLADALHATECSMEDIGFAELMQPSDLDALRRLLKRATRLLRECVGAPTRRQPKAFAAARTLRSARATAYTVELRTRGVLEAADAAWELKEYGRVHEILNPIREALGEVHRRRLEFADGKMRWS
jgi:hypothetical protein